MTTAPLSAQVLYVSSTDCFVHLSGSLLGSWFPHDEPPMPLVLRLNWTEGLHSRQCVHVTWSGRVCDQQSLRRRRAHSGLLASSSLSTPATEISATSLNRSSHSLQIDEEFATLLNLAEGTEVSIRALDPFTLPMVHSCTVEPLSADEWEMMELQPGYLEGEILNQLRVISPGQSFLLHLHHRSRLQMRITALDPDAPVALLLADSEMIVAPKLRPITASDSRKNFAAARYRSRLLRFASLPVQPTSAEPVPRPDVAAARRSPTCHSGSETEYRERSTDPNDAFVYVHPSTAARFDWRAGSLLVLRALFRAPVASVTEEHQESSLQRANHALHKRYTERFRIVYRVLSLSEQVEPGTITSRSTTLEEQLAGGIVESMCFARLRVQMVFWPAQQVERICLIPVRWSLVDTTTFLFEKTLTKPPLSAKDQSMILAFLRQHVQSQGSRGWSFTQGTIVEIPLDVELGDHCPRFFCLAINGSTVPDPLNLIEQFAPEDPSGSGEPKSYRAFYTISSPDIERVELSFEREVLTRTPSSTRFTNPIRCKDLGGFTSLFTELGHLARAHFQWEGQSADSMHVASSVLPCPSPLILLCGGAGSGKTAALEAFRSHTESTFHTYSTCLRCNTLVGQAFETIREQFQHRVADALNNRPAVIFLDDLDAIASHPSEDGAAASSGYTLTQIAEYLLDVMARVSSQLPGQVLFVATCASKEELHPSLCSVVTLKKALSIDPPKHRQRSQMLECILRKQKGCKIVGTRLRSLCGEIAALCDGYLPGDLVQVVARAVHEATVRVFAASTPAATGRVDMGASPAELHSQPCILLEKQDFDRALQDFCPVSLQGVPLCESSTLWSDIGGLQEVRKALRETYEWPVKYKRLYACAPIRMRSGILLFGPSGCGKTLLAGAVAKCCGLNFISIKGPELLNKYIGASEQAVRDLFKKASAAAPCILFFDEFDSIAPRRGHDSTGVTDRVVNQFLTQLDGVESAEGVYVLAASSRPDLVDPALLRPGRLDKCLYCAMPNASERLDILRRLANKLSLQDNVDLRWLSEEKHTRGFSGADLQSLLYSAQLIAVHERLDRLEKSPAIESTDLLTTRPQVSTAHLQQALAQQRPSISEAELRRLTSQYASFMADRGADYQTGLLEGQRQTLA